MQCNAMMIMGAGVSLYAHINLSELNISIQKFTRISLLNRTYDYRKKLSYLTWKSNA